MAMRSGPIRQTTYTSLVIPIPASFLSSSSSPPSSILTPIAFGPSLPEYAPHKAFLLPGLLSAPECQELLALAESASPTSWAPALVSLGPGLEAANPGYRNSDRIIWDRREIVDRLWARIMQVEGVAEMMRDVPLRSGRGSRKPGRWELRGLNERMRFLRYGPGMFFKPHCDAHYCAEMDGKAVETFYTLQLYLNDEGLKGGATSFLSRDGKRRLDVKPQTGLGLIFQHDGLYHEGAEVTAGLKYTLRTDVMYTWEEDIV